MVRVTRFSFDDGMNVDVPRPRDSFNDDDLDDFLADEQQPQQSPGPARSRRQRTHPDDRRPDRRHSSDAEWKNPDPPAEREKGSEDRA